MSSPQNSTRPGARLDLAEDAVEERRLAAAVRADHADDLARLDRQADAVDGADRAVGLADVPDLEERRHAPLPRSARRAKRSRIDSSAAGQPDHQRDDGEAEDREIPVLGEAQPFRQQDHDDRADDRPEEAARSADDHHQQHHERCRDGERAGLDVLHERGEIDAADPGVGGADREGEQRIGGDVDAQALGADRVVAQARRRRVPQGERSTRARTSASTMVEA